MAELRGIRAITLSAVNDLANRWFQPLTHVSGSQRRAVSLGMGRFSVNAGNAKAAINNGSAWHNARHSLFACCSPAMGIAPTGGAV